MELRQMEYLVTLADERHFTRAAQLMGVLEGREEEMAAVVAEAPKAKRAPGETAGAGSMPTPEQPPAPPKPEEPPV